MKLGVDQEPEGGQPAIIAAAAHELKSPLTLITSIAHTLRDESLSLSGVQRVELLERLLLTSQRTLRLMQQLTLSYRLDSPKQLTFDFDLQPINAYQICQEVLEEMTPYSAAMSQQIRLRGGSCPHLVVANRDIVRDIVTNLVDNALRHNQPGTVIDIYPQCRRDFVRIHVHDNGDSFDSGQLARLRRSLGQEPQPLINHAGTSGLGIYIVDKLANAMGGAIGLGRAGKGTTFFVDLIRSRQLSLLS